MRLINLCTFLSSTTGALAATFTSCSESRIATLEVAIGRATTKAYPAIDHLEANPNGSDLQTTRYGEFNAARYSKVLTAFKVCCAITWRILFNKGIPKIRDRNPHPISQQRLPTIFPARAVSYLHMLETCMEMSRFAAYILPDGQQLVIVRGGVN